MGRGRGKAAIVIHNFCRRRFETTMPKEARTGRLINGNLRRSGWRVLTGGNPESSWLEVEDASYFLCQER